MNVVTIREFKAKLSHYLKHIEDGIVVTSRGKKIALVTTFNDEVTTLVPTLVTTSKQEIITSLRQKIETIETQEEPKTEYIGDCEACRKLRIKTPAVGIFEVFTDDSMQKRGLCQRHIVLGVVPV